MNIIGGRKLKILVTGSNGFLGKNLISKLEELENIERFPYDIDTNEDLLRLYCRECDFVYNLAGVNRPENINEFMEGNFGFASSLVNYLRQYRNFCPIMNSSSIQAVQENYYGKSKRAGEDMLFNYSKETGADVYIYRFPNIFGKWCRPNYNSAVATFCHNIANNLPIKVNDSNTLMHLVYIDDVVRELLCALNGHPHMNSEGYCYVPEVHEKTLGEIVSLIYSFQESRDSLIIPDSTEGSFEKKLYSTYLSYLPVNKFSYELLMHEDERGSFTEILKSVERGQVSVNISKPGIMKGNHWHHSKNEKFIVVKGKALIQFRKHGSNEIIEYHVCGDKLEVVDIPTGYIHTIINEGDTDLVTLMWANECFDSENPDTVYEPLESKKKEVD